MTAKLLAEVEAMEKAQGKPPPKKASKRSPAPKKAKPAYKPVRETKAVLRERQKVYKLIEKVWKNPKAKNLRPDDVPRYIRGIIIAEKGLKPKEDWDHYLFEELWDLIELWPLRK